MINECQNFENSRCLCHKSGTDCINIEVDEIKWKIIRRMRKMENEDVKLYLDTIADMVELLKGRIRK